MDNKEKLNKIISHSYVSQNFSEVQLKVKNRLLKNLNDEERTQQLALLDRLSEFELGRFLLMNKGLNGYWTNYILTYPHKTKSTNLRSLELFLLEQSPTMRATQERFNIFLSLNQQQVKNGVKLASIPSGLGGELFYLDLSQASNLDLFLIDLDPLSLAQAKYLAQENNIYHNIHYIQENAWNITYKNEFDLISSNGITIYESDDNKVIELFHKFYEALTQGGMLVTSSLTPPPTIDKNSEWEMSKIDLKMLELQKILFSDVLQVIWQCFRASTLIKQMLQSVGFVDVGVQYDNARMFPTIFAKKP